MKQFAAPKIPAPKLAKVLPDPSVKAVSEKTPIAYPKGGNVGRRLSKLEKTGFQPARTNHWTGM